MIASDDVDSWEEIVVMLVWANGCGGAFGVSDEADDVVLYGRSQVE